MAKRFTDTDKWERPWFRKLPLPYKLLWSYITDKCDIAGIWYADFELASFMIGEQVNQTEALRLFEKQVKILPGGARWFIAEFVAFQYGTLVPNNNMHRSVLMRLHDASLTSNPAPKLPLKVPSGGDKDKDRVKVKDKVKDVGAAFDAFWGAYPRKVGKGAAQKAWGKVRPDAALAAKIVAAVVAQRSSHQWSKDGGQFIPHPTTWLNQGRWDDEAPRSSEVGSAAETAAFLAAREHF